MNTTTSLDLRTLAPQERHPLVFNAFENLPVGAALELANDHDPRPLRDQLQARFGEGLTWAYLETGPAQWKVRIGKNKVAAAAGNCCSGGACCG